MNRTTLIQQLREVAIRALPTVTSRAQIEAIRAASIDVRSQATGALLREVAVVGGTAGLALGDSLYLLHTADGNLLALSARGLAGGTTTNANGQTQASVGGGIAAAVVHSHDNLYYGKSVDQAMLSAKANVIHAHPPPDRLTAVEGTIGGFAIGPDTLTASGLALGRLGYLGLGPYAAVPTTYGNFPGVFLGYNLTSDLAQMSLYADATHYMQWDGANLALSGTITALAGAIGGWTINSSAIVKDTGVAATSAGLEPVDWPFYAGAIYTGRAAAPFRVSNAGLLYATGATISGTLTATGGSIGGWTIAAHSLTGGQVVLGDSGLIQGNYLAGLRGYQLDAAGNAEVNNLVARGEFRASVFSIDEQHAVGGTQVVLPAAGLYAQVTTL